MKKDEIKYELALFAGAGGGILGGKLCGTTCVGAVEIEEYPRKVLLQRQQDGILPRFPIWDDVSTFRIDNPECSGYIKKLRSVRNKLVISGGFPCQDISAAGKGAGIADGTRSGLWFEFSRIIGEIRPAKVFVENSSLLISRGLDRVLSDLAEMGYNAKWGIVSAENAGAPHQRKRIWLLATNPDSNGRTAGSGNARGESETKSDRADPERCCRGSWWETEPGLGRMAHGVANRVDRLKAIGNGQVPAVVKLAWELLNDL